MFFFFRKLKFFLQTLYVCTYINIHRMFYFYTMNDAIAGKNLLLQSCKIKRLLLQTALSFPAYIRNVYVYIPYRTYMRLSMPI